MLSVIRLGCFFTLFSRRSSSQAPSHLVPSHPQLLYYTAWTWPASTFPTEIMKDTARSWNASVRRPRTKTVKLVRMEHPCLLWCFVCTAGWISMDFLLSVLLEGWLSHPFHNVKYYQRFCWIPRDPKSVQVSLPMMRKRLI